MYKNNKRNEQIEQAHRIFKKKKHLNKTKTPFKQKRMEFYLCKIKNA